ncbi:MAG: acetate kinase [Promicromonosporaceae bacterium]|nr:acetate kinase [Promicromonosporaceae bacterium]
MSNVLVLNAGSSSLKYQLVNPVTSEVLADGIVEKIGEDVSRVKHEGVSVKVTRDLQIADHAEALKVVLDLYEDLGPRLSEVGVAAVGHRVVHGGPTYSAPVVINDDVVAGIEALVPLAPLHNPANVTGIRVARQMLPDVPHVAVFDTAFFSTLKPEAYTYAIDADLAKQHHIRRYGFHGTSHQYVSGKVSELLGRDDLKQVVLHLGNGASASAVKNGVAVDTSMGLTPLEGLIMGTRSGDLDPAIIFHLHRVAGMDLAELDDLLNKQSGIKGLYGDNDMRKLETDWYAGIPKAHLVMDIYRHRLTHYVGAYAAVMGGIDVLTFTAGVGENDPQLRLDMAEALSFLGFAIDREKNAPRSKEARNVSPDGHEGPQVMVVPTNEELAIAQQTVATLDGIRVDLAD